MRAPRVTSAPRRIGRWAAEPLAAARLRRASRVALLLVGARWIRSADEPGAAAGGVSVSLGVRLGRLARRRLRRRAPAASDVVVHVAGAVREPGRLPAAGRVARRRRGRASRRCHRRAELDGAQPRGAAHRRSANRHARQGRGRCWGALGVGRRATADGPISLGTATVEELDTIEGIGPVTAQKIIEFRDEHGGIVVGRPARPDRRHRPGDDGRPARPAPAVAGLRHGSRERGGIAWRFAVLGGAAAGLALSPAGCRAVSAGLAGSVLALGLAVVLGRSRGRVRDAPARGARLARGSRRGGLRAGRVASPCGWRRSTAAPSTGRPGSRRTVRGFVTAVPRRSHGEVRVRIQTAEGRLAVEAPEPVPDLPIGSQVSATRHAARARALGGRLPGALGIARCSPPTVALTGPGGAAGPWR